MGEAEQLIAEIKEKTESLNQSIAKAHELGIIANVYQTYLKPVKRCAK